MLPCAANLLVAACCGLLRFVAACSVMVVNAQAGEAVGGGWTPPPSHPAGPCGPCHRCNDGRCCCCWQQEACFAKKCWHSCILNEIQIQIVNFGCENVFFIGVVMKIPLISPEEDAYQSHAHYCAQSYDHSLSLSKKRHKSKSTLILHVSICQ